MAERANSEDTAREFIALGLSLLEKGDLAGAEKAIVAATKLCPHAMEAWGALYKVLSTDPSRADEAEIAFQKSTKGTLLNPLPSKKDKPSQITFDVGPFSGGSGVFRGRILPHETPDDGKEEEIAQARTAEAAGDWLAAQKRWERVIEIDPSDTWTWVQYAQILGVHLKDYEASEAAYRRAIEEDPTDDWVYGKLGIMLADFMDRVDEGQSLLRHAIELDENEPFYHAWLGWSLSRQSDENEEAVKHLQRAVELAPDYHWAWFHYAYVSSLLEGGMDNAVTFYKTAISLKPDDSASYFNLGVIYQEEIQNYKQAAQCLEKVTKIRPEYAVVWRRLGDLYGEQLNQPKKALAAYEKFLALEPEDDEVLVSLANVQSCGLGMDDEAIVLLEKAIELNDKNADAHGILGAILYEKNVDDFERAALHLECAIALEPNYAYAYQHLLQIKLAQKAPKVEIEPLFAFLLKENPDDVGLVMDHCTWVAYTLQETIEGRRLYLEALKKFPDVNQLRFKFILFTGAYSDCYVDFIPYLEWIEEWAEEEALLCGMLASYYSIIEQDDDRAEMWLERMLELEPEEHYTLHMLAEYYLFRALNFEKAKAYLTRAKALSNHCSPLPMHQALIAYFIDGDKEQTWTLVEEARKIDEENDDIDEGVDDERLLIAYAEGDYDFIITEAQKNIEDSPNRFENYLLLMIALEKDPQNASKCADLMKKATKENINGCDIEATIAWLKAPLQSRKPY